MAQTIQKGRPNQMLVPWRCESDNNRVPNRRNSDTQQELPGEFSPRNGDVLANVKSPFLKWAGRKTSIVSAIKKLLPENARCFIEPFVGSGAVFLNTEYRKNLLADTNEDIINLYRILKSDGQPFINRSRKLFVPENNQEARFYELRDEFNKASDLERRAELFIYLNRHCYNGLCRYNSRGQFNVPFGRYGKPYFPADELEQFCQKLAAAELAVQDFRISLENAKRGDVVYCDPPYVPLSRTASFTSYAKGGFGPKDQKELVAYCVAAAQRGAAVVISNHDTLETRDLYKDANQIVSLRVQRMISCNGEGRNMAEELLAVYGK